MAAAARAPAAGSTAALAVAAGNSLPTTGVEQSAFAHDFYKPFA